MGGGGGGLLGLFGSSKESCAEFVSAVSSCDADILYPPAIPSSRAGDTMEASAQKVSSLPAAASMSGEETVMPESTIEQITAKILHVEGQINSTSDAEERKQLRDKERQLRDKERQLRDEKKLLLQLQGATSGKFSILLGGAKLVQAWEGPKTDVKRRHGIAKRCFSIENALGTISIFLVSR